METHPFPSFSPPGCRYLLLGSFVALAAEDSSDDSKYNWYYANGRNQFWPILEMVYGEKLATRKKQKELFTKLGMAVTDLVQKCDRVKKDSADTSLKKMVFNRINIRKILDENDIARIYFSSRFAEKLYFRNFGRLAESHPEVEYKTLPSPSPRYARMTFRQKVEEYKKLLPATE